jgi:hypothetical protein
LVSWNAGDLPPFSQDLPEQGTVIRLRTSALAGGQSYTFQAVPPEIITTGPLGTSIFVKHRLINNGSLTLKDFFICLWHDPDLGEAGNDLAGCDPSSNVFFCYNGAEDDDAFGGPPPALGYQVLEGPIVYSLGDTAFVDGRTVPNYRNMSMYSYTKYLNGTDPSSYAMSYMYMKGLDASSGGAPYYNPTTGQPTRFVMSGDPVAGTGWVDNTPADCRTMASFGPITFRPGDTQQVVFRIAVGQGADRLGSVTALGDILDYEHNPFECCLERVGNANGQGGDEPTVVDVSVLIDARFISGVCAGVISCMEEADVNRSGGLSPICEDITIGDISFLIDYLFITGPTLGLPDCQ